MSDNTKKSVTNILRQKQRRILEIVLIVLSKRIYLCKILLRDAASPFYAELQRPARIRDVCTLDQHPLDEDPVLWGRQDVFDSLFVTASLNETNAGGQDEQNSSAPDPFR